MSTVFRTLTAEIHAASELNDNYRGILDEARNAGVARLRDKDGQSLLIIPEEAARAGMVASELARFARDLVAAYSANRRAAPELYRATILAGSWPWLRSLDDDDLDSFLAEMASLYVEAAATHDLGNLYFNLRAWQMTASELDEPRIREALLGASEADDYVEAPRPEGGTADAEGAGSRPAE
jgi:hypothetical protein